MYVLLTFMIDRDLCSWTNNSRKVKGKKLRRKVHLHHYQPPRNLGGSSRNLLKGLFRKSHIDVLYQCHELVIIRVFSAPHEFSQISSMVTEMCTIWQHMDLSVSPITFYGICAGSIVSVNKFLRMIYSDKRVTYLCQVSVGLPTVTMYYWPWSNPLLNKWQECSGLSVMNWDHEEFLLVVFFPPTVLQLCGHNDISSFQIYFRQSQLPLHYHLFVHFVPSLNICNISWRTWTTQ